MPELPEVEAARRRLEPAMTGRVFIQVMVHRPDLRAAFPPQFGVRLTGRTALAVERRAKYLLIPLSSGETLLMHLGMSGSFRISRGPLEHPPGLHDHLVFEMSSGLVVAFNDPRRFGQADLLTAAGVASHPAMSRLGPEPLSAAFNAAALARACRGSRRTLKVALLDQRVVSGLGNIYAAEALHLARLSPQRLASSLATSSGAPREPARRLVSAIKQVLNAAVVRQSKAAHRGTAFRVYDREGERCRRSGCGGTIKRVTQAGRSTSFCPRCQR